MLGLLSLVGFAGCAPTREAAAPLHDEETIVAPPPKSADTKTDEWNHRSTLTIGEDSSDLVVDSPPPSGQSPASPAPVTQTVEPRLIGGRMRSIGSGAFGGRSRGVHTVTTGPGGTGFTPTPNRP
jgi:hypothetical protein